MIDRATLGIIFTNMHDEELSELTEKRTFGSIPFGGRYRLIDFALSNMVNAGISDIGVITKSNYLSLMDHLGSGREWDLARKRGGLTILPPFGRSNTSGVYRGRLEALSNFIAYIRSSAADDVLISDSDVIANIDLKDFIARHNSSGAEITILYKKVDIPAVGSERYNLVEFDSAGRLVDVQMRPPVSGEHQIYMDIAIFKKELLLRLLENATSRNEYSLVHYVYVGMKDQLDIRGYEFTGYASKIKSLASYYRANMDLLQKEIRDELFQPNRPIYTKVRDEVSAKYGLDAKVSNSLVADGCVIDGEVENSIIFRGVRIAKGACVKNSIIMQSGIVGENVLLDYVITDKDVTITDSRSLMGYKTYPVYIAKGSRV